MKSSDRRALDQADATLAAIDAALETGHVRGEGDERERELGLLALTLRGGAPEPSTPFAADLERRVGPASRRSA